MADKLRMKKKIHKEDGIGFRPGSRSQVSQAFLRYLNKHISDQIQGSKSSDNLKKNDPAQQNSDLPQKQNKKNE